jgi:site-specific recombinase XerD
LENGAAITDLQSLLGHASVSTTQIYAKMVDARARKSLEALSFGT